MNVKTSIFGTINLSGEDAKKFTNQVTFGRPKKAAVDGLIKGMQLLNEVNTKGSAVIDKQKEKTGHTLCECGEGVHLHEAGYEADLHMCAVCRCMVADPVDFEQNNVS